MNDDGAFATDRGQMRKGEFLVALRAGVLTTAEAALAGTGHSAQECPWIEHWFEYYHQQDARHVERAIHKYAPETLSATTADEYIPHITERVRRALGTWVRTGQVTGVPDGVPTRLPEQTGLSGGRMTAPGLRFKSREGGPRPAGGVREIQAQLGAGRSLDSQTQGRMEATFGTSLSDVRVHTDGKATGLADRMNAHAFAVGEHIAFAGGEYQPGTLIGDALIAHELATWSSNAAPIPMSRRTAPIRTPRWNRTPTRPRPVP